MSNDDLTEAGIWFTRLDTPVRDVGGKDRSDFSSWYRSNAEHRRAFAAVAATGAVIADLADDPALVGIAQSALARVHARRRRTRLVVTGVVGALVMVPVAALTFRHWQAPATSTTAPVRVVETGVGERREVALDGSVRIVLDTNTRVTISDGAVTIAGQAYAAAGTRPAQVRLPDGMTISTQGEVNIRIDDEGATVLAEGAPATVHSAASTTVLAPDHILRIKAGRSSIARAADPAAITGWRSGWLFFDDTPLREAAAEINRYRRTPIRLLHGTGALRISGSFRIDDTGAFLRAVGQTLPAKVNVSPYGATIGIARGHQKIK